MIFSLLGTEVNWFLEFGPKSVSLEVGNISNETVVNSIELPLSVWNFLESQRFRFIEIALTGAQLTREQQQRIYEVQENLEVPEIQDPIRGWESREIVLDNFSTSDDI